MLGGNSMNENQSSQNLKSPDEGSQVPDNDLDDEIPF